MEIDPVGQDSPSGNPIPGNIKNFEGEINQLTEEGQYGTTLANCNTNNNNNSDNNNKNNKNDDKRRGEVSTIKFIYCEGNEMAENT